MPDSLPPSRSIAALKVSGHLMTLEPGVFCVFHVPGAVQPDTATGLPGVRLSRPPTDGAQPSRVEVSTFGDDGWLGADGAALIRVSGGPSQVLVTIYQDRDGAQEAPNLRVQRLSAPAAAVPEPAAHEIEAHIYGRGDVGAQLGEWVGEPGSERWVEGFAVKPAGAVAPEDVEYQAVLGRGWLSPWAEGGAFCGSRGMALPILGLRVRLRGPAAEAFDAVVSATFVDGAKAGPVRDGEACEAESLAPLEAFRIELRPRARAKPKPARKR